MAELDRLTNRATTFIRQIDEEIQAASHIKPYVKQLVILKEKYLLLAATTERYSSLIFVHYLNKKALNRVSLKLIEIAIALLALAFGLSFFTPIIACFFLGLVIGPLYLNCFYIDRKVKESKEHAKKCNECTEIINKTQEEADFVMKNMLPNVIKDLKFSAENWSNDDDDNDF